MTAYLMVTGSRDWDDELVIRTALGEAYTRLFDVEDALGPTLLVGGAVGADQMAEGIWKMSRLPYKRIPADWTMACGAQCEPGHRKPHRSGKTYCPMAGFYRNRKMIEHQPALVLAFIRPCRKEKCTKRKSKHDSHGTAQAVELAQDANIPVWQYRA